MDGNIGWDIAGWGIHMFDGGRGSNRSIVTRNIFFDCHVGAALFTGHSNLVANNLFVNSSTGVCLFRESAEHNMLFNNAALSNRADASVAALRPAEQHGKEQRFHQPPGWHGCCNPGFPRGAADRVSLTAAADLTSWVAGAGVLDGRPAPGSALLGAGGAVPRAPWLGNGSALNIGAFP
eukprot:gene4435-6600_t